MWSKLLISFKVVSTYLTLKSLDNKKVNDTKITEMKNKKIKSNFLKLFININKENNKFDIKNNIIAALSPEKISPKKHIIKKIKQIILKIFTFEDIK